MIRTPIICLLSILTFLFGCKTVNTPELVQFVAARAGDAARIATIVDLQAHPEHRIAFQAAKVAMDGLLRGTNYSSADFKAVLAKLPVKEFQGAQGAMVLEGALLVYDLVTMFAYDVQSAPALAAVMTSVRDGISGALSTPVDSIVRSKAIASGKPALIPVRIIRI